MVWKRDLDVTYVRLFPKKSLTPSIENLNDYFIRSLVNNTKLITNEANIAAPVTYA